MWGGVGTERDGEGRCLVGRRESEGIKKLIKRKIRNRECKCAEPGVKREAVIGGEGGEGRNEKK